MISHFSSFSYPESEADLIETKNPDDDTTWDKVQFKHWVVFRPGKKPDPSLSCYERESNKMCKKKTTPETNGKDEKNKPNSVFLILFIISSVTDGKAPTVQSSSGNICELVNNSQIWDSVSV